MTFESDVNCKTVRLACPHLSLVQIQFYVIFIWNQNMDDLRM